MKILLSDDELRLLTAENISFEPDKEYTDQEAFELLEKVYDAEIKYSNYPSSDMRAMAKAAGYAHLADIIQNSIPDS